MPKMIRPIGQRVIIHKAYMRKDRLGEIIRINDHYPNGIVEYLVRPIPYEGIEYYCFEDDLKDVSQEKKAKDAI